MAMQELIEKVVEGNDLSVAEAHDAFEEIMSGKTTDAQIAALIVALRIKGETIDEITGAADVMREKAEHVIPESDEYLVDTCGTGGDNSGTFNISTATALVTAAAGARVAKHGNRSVSSACGSADVLEALGVNVAATPLVMKRCLDDIGLAFLFAPSLHKAMKYAIGARKDIALRTIFNILGPLTNPSFAKRQLLGVFSPRLTEPLARVLKNLGSTRVYVVHGENGMDELSLSGETQVAELSDGDVRAYRVKPEDFGLSRAPIAALAGGTAEKNAAIVRAVLSGDRGPCREVVLLNAAFAIAASGICVGPEEGVKLATDAIDSGAANLKLEQLVEKTNES